MKRFEVALNRHGYPFQYAVIRRAEELRKAGRSPWLLEAVEYPVEVQGQHTRIDFVLSRYDHRRQKVLKLLVAECKRVNPSFCSWLFVRAPYGYRPGSYSADVIIEAIKNDPSKSLRPVVESQVRGGGSIYHIGIEVKEPGAKGDPSGPPGREAIEEAATQVMRGVNGLIALLGLRGNVPEGSDGIPVYPVIFTTAQIWTSEADIASADLLDGRIELESTAVVRQPWLWFQYHVSHGLRHAVRSITHYGSDSGMFRSDFARTIAVVGPDGIEPFLSSFLDW